jgi:hypothetical protein
MTRKDIAIAESEKLRSIGRRSPSYIHRRGRNARTGTGFEAASNERHERPCEKFGSLSLLSISCLLSQRFVIAANSVRGLDFHCLKNRRVAVLATTTLT